MPAFLALAADLVAAGAPDTLAHRAVDAAEDEIRHARICAALASKWANERLVPMLPAVPLRHARSREHALVRLATESWLDGCLNEGAAAAWARAGAESAEDEDARSAQRTIAQDENRHAALGWDVLQWAMNEGKGSVADAVHDIRNAPSTGEPLDVPSNAKGRGFVTRAEMERLASTHAQDARQKLDRIFGAASRR